jgi:hypothetical protein
MEITIQYFDGCPNWKAAREAVSRAAPEARITLQTVETDEDAQRLRFRGSPTILFEGTDPWADPDAPFGLSCRVFQTATGLAGLPSEAQLVKALRQAAAG